MEKYRKFADPATGINPFLNPSLKPMSFLDIVFFYGIGIPLLIAKLPILICVITSLAVFHGLIKHLLFVSSLKRISSLLVNKIFHRIILLLFGFYDIRIDFGRKLPIMKSGHIVLCNNSSPIDYFFLNYLISPLYLTQNYSDTRVSFSKSPGIFSLIFNFRKRLPSEKSDKNLMKLEKISQRAIDSKEGPLLIFFEGAPTNGTGILEFDNLFLEDLHNIQVKTKRKTVVFLINYGTDHISPINLHSSPLIHLLKLMMRFKNTIKVKQMTVDTGNDDFNDFAASVKNFYVNSKAPQLKLTWKDYSDFLDYWEKTNVKNYTKEKKLN